MKKNKQLSKKQEFKNEFKKQLAIAFLATFAFLIALTWRDFISEIVNNIISTFGIQGQTYLIKLTAAILITVIAVIGIIIVSKYNSEKISTDKEGED